MTDYPDNGLELPSTTEHSLAMIASTLAGIHGEMKKITCLLEKNFHTHKDEERGKDDQ